MYITIKNNDDGYSKIIDAGEILSVEKFVSSHRDLSSKIQITYKKKSEVTVVDFSDDEEREFFLQKIHRILSSTIVEQAPPKEVRELNHLIEEDE